LATARSASGAVTVVAEAPGREDRRTKLAVFVFQAFERGEGNAVSAVDVVKGFKEFGFALMIGVTAVWALGLR